MSNLGEHVDDVRSLATTQVSPVPRLLFFGNEFPSDDLKDIFRRLVRHSKDRRFRILASFIDEATRVIQDEISKLPLDLRKHVPHFDTVLTIPEHGDFRQTGLGAAMESALLVVLQLSGLIGYHEARGLDLDYVENPPIIAGLSIGLFAGAAVALARSLADLAKMGAESLRVSFRLGIYVADLSKKLEAPQSDGTLQSWAHVVTGIGQDGIHHELSRFNETYGGQDLTKVFISAADKNSVSVSGPPSRLKAAFQFSQELRYSKSLALPVYDGLCHASHVYSKEDIETILDLPSTVICPTHPVRLSLSSSQTGKPYLARTAAELFEEISIELVTGTIYLDNVVRNVTDYIEEVSPSPSKLEMESFRLSIVFQGMLDTVQSKFPGIAVQRKDMIEWIFDNFGERRPSSTCHSKIAIVGMSCRMPGGGNDLDLFWDNLEQGRNACTTVPPDRFDIETHYDPSGQTENASQTKFGNFIDRPGYFDAAFFTMSPKEAIQTDPMHRLTLVTAYEAMEMAGIVPGRTPSTSPDRIGTYYGQASDDWRELNASQNIGTYAVPGGVRGFTTGRINYFFKFSGPALTIDTACSSSMAAVHAGCEALWTGEVDTVIAGGVNIITDPDNYAGLCNAFFLSKTGQCKVWDEGADGYCRGDAVGSIVLKRLEDAEADNDNVLAVILSAATNHSAEAISITHPHAGAQRDNYRQVLHRAGINPLDVSYIEMHGTGTQAGDAIESESVLDVFAPLSPRRHRDQRLHLGAVKSNIGHSEAGAGISSIIKACLCFQRSSIPHHIGIHTKMNPAIPKDLERRNAGLVTGQTAWLRPNDKKRLALVNSFGASGGNTTILLEDAPIRMKQGTSSPTDTRPVHAIVLSAKSKKSLQANVERLLLYLDERPDTSLDDLSYTLCGRRMHHSLRLGTAVSSISDLQKFLRSSLNGDGGINVLPVPSDAPAVVLAFTGQGASTRGAHQELFDDFPLFRDQVLQLDRLVRRLNFPSVVPALTGSIDDEVDSPVTSQLSIVVLEIALARFWLALGIQPRAVIGHSLGEYSALVIAGVLSVADVLYLVGRRAQLTERLCELRSHTMLSAAASAKELHRVLQEESRTSAVEYEVSCQNTHQDTVIGGRKEDIRTIHQTLETKGYKCVLLDIPFAFHTSQMESILNELEDLAQKIPFKAPTIPLLSTLLGRPVFDAKTVNNTYLRNQTRNTVRFADAVDAAQELGMVDDKTVWIDCGPHPVCVGFVRKMISQARIAPSCRRNEDNMATISKSLVTLHLSGVPLWWNEYFKPHEKGHALLHDLPKYSWNETNYWIPYLGTWCLDKARLKHGGNFLPAAPPVSSLRTSLIHQVTKEVIGSSTAEICLRSDLQHPDFLEAVHGHRINNCGVATSSIWTDMALKVGEYLYRRLLPGTEQVHMNVCNLEVLHAKVASKTPDSSQLLELHADLNMDTQYMSVAWFDVCNGERTAESFASAGVRFEDPVAWAGEWARVSHLILGRIQALRHMAEVGEASRMSKPMAYKIFQNVVDYADRYRGIDSMVLDGYEAYADITLSSERHGEWHTPPHWIDPVCHLAGLVMNGSDLSNTEDYFFVTPGSDAFRLSRPLEPSGKYQSYVRMFPMAEEPGKLAMYAGDVYILQNDRIIGMLTQIRFRRVPRVLMDRFFSAPSGTTSGSQVVDRKRSVELNTKVTKMTDGQANIGLQQKHQTTTVSQNSALQNEEKRENSRYAQHQISRSSTPQSTPASSANVLAEPDVGAGDGYEGLVGQCLQVIANETNLELADLTPDATFVQLGVDSLMSLVLSEKFRAEVGIEVKSSLFLECPSVGDMADWIDKNC